MRRFLLGCMLLVFLVFLALGTWQVKRLFWKLDLIERVDRRVHAVAVDAPGPQVWPRINADGHEYLHVRISGSYLYAQSVRVQAATALGAGFWLLTPLQGDDGNFYFINRGYVSGTAPDVQAEAATAATAAAAQGRQVSVAGLLRITEPHGGFLRHNDAAADRWFSRDISAIAASRKLDLTRVAPYFIDAEAAASQGEPARVQQMVAAGEPVPGLTVIAFHNSHLVYAFTWYALALMMAGAGFWILRDERRRAGAGAATFDQDDNDGKQGR